MKSDKWTALRAITLACAVLVLTIVVVIRYEGALNKINWALVAIIFGFAFVAFVLYRWQARKGNEYDVTDLFMTNAKADLWKHMVLLFGVISAWVLVQQALSKTLTTEMLSLVLAIFVGKEAIGTIAVAIATRPAATPGSGDQTVNVNNAPSAASSAVPLKVDVLNLPDSKPSCTIAAEAATDIDSKAKPKKGKQND